MEQVIVDHLGKTSSLFGSFPNFIFKEDELISNHSFYAKGDYHQTIINKKLEGICISLFDNGQIEKETKYCNDKEIGKWRYWHRNGNLIKEENYQDGRRNGKWTSWYDDGQIKEEGEYHIYVDIPDIHGMKNGKWTYWYKNGQKESEGEYRIYEDMAEYRDNIKEGKWTYWNENGEIREGGEYRKNMREGIWTSRYRYGVII